MAKSTTYKGAMKPYGASGHFDEPQRHALQAKGIRTGNLADATPMPVPVYTKWGVRNLEAKPEPEKEPPKTEEGLEDLQAEAKEEKAAQPKKPDFKEFWAKAKETEEKVAEGLRQAKEDYDEGRAAEEARQAQQRKAQLLRDLGENEDSVTATSEPTVREEAQAVDEDGEMVVDEESLPKKFGTFLAHLTDEDYTAKDMATLTDPQLEMLAVRFKEQTKDDMNLFGEPDNVFVDELKRRYQARAELIKEKAQIKADIASNKKEPGLFDDLF